jgi:hypothetical protein
LRGEANDDFFYLMERNVEFSAAAAFRHHFLLAEEASEGVRPFLYNGLFSNFLK